MNKRSDFFVLLVVLLVGIVYRSWIGGGEIIGGDWVYLFSEMVGDVSHVPSSWQSGYGGGLGGLSPAYFLSTYNFLFAWIAVLTGISWVVVYKFFWFLLPVLLLAAGGWKLLSVVYPLSRAWMRALAAMIVATNTYILMVAGGGQMGVVFAVSLFPWVLIAFFRFLRSQNLKESLLFGVALGIQISFDPRFAYLSVISMGILYCFVGHKRELLWKRLRFGVVAGSISILLNFYWVLPLLILKENTLDSLGSAYTTVEALRFFSFADFSHTLSLLHPNWPENLFGKTYFLQPEFIFLPIVAFLSLFFTKKLKENPFVFGFAMLGLVGAFLSKGANEPLGNIYVWAFEHIPGFVMFRDPTKFYLLGMISYAVLIPYTLYSLTPLIKKYTKKFLWIVPALFLLYWIVLIRPAVSGSLGGTFTKRAVPMQYVELKKLFQKEHGFFRTLWIPRQSRFTFTSSNEISIEAGPQLGATDAATLTDNMNTVDIKEHLATLGVRYIVVPYDPYGEIFVDDRKYSQTKKDAVEKALDRVPWLTKVQFGGISVYKTPQSKDHFWLKHGELVGWRRIADDYYEVEVIVNQPTTLMMSESYHPGWHARINDQSVSASKAPYGVMSFSLPLDGSYTVGIEFVPRRYYLWGRWISIITILLVFLFVYTSRTHDT